MIAYILMAAGFLVLGYLLREAYRRDLATAKVEHATEIAHLQAEVAKWQQTAEQLADDLVRERRGATILRTGLLEAQGEVDNLVAALTWRGGAAS